LKPKSIVLPTWSLRVPIQFDNNDVADDEDDDNDDDNINDDDRWVDDHDRLNENLHKKEWFMILLKVIMINVVDNI
jgi:hypothetical protein